MGAVVLATLATACWPIVSVAAGEPGGDDVIHAGIKARYIEFLTGTESTFGGKFAAEAAAMFVDRVRKPVRNALESDWSEGAGRAFAAFPEEPGFKQDSEVYQVLLQQTLPALAFAYRVKADGNPYFENPEVLRSYVRCLDYLHGRGLREGMTFHNNPNRMNAEGAPKPPPGAANLVKMELRMGSLCQSLLLMEPFIRETDSYRRALALVRHLEMLGRTSGHTRYFEPYENPPEFRHRVQSDAIQLYGDTTLVSALLETDPRRRREMLREAQQVYTDSLKVVPGWADTIKPDFTGFHHRGIYGNAYTGGFIPQASFAVWLLDGTPHAVARESAENLKRLIKTYRLYCQKYSMPFGIRGRMPLNSDNIKTQVFSGILIQASALGLDDREMKGVFARLWDPEQVGLKFLFTGGRGKPFRGFLALDMLRQLDHAGLQPEPEPEGFWYKPYGGLAIHRRADWMAAVKGHSKYVWDYENGERQNVYGQYLSHGMLTIYAAGDPVGDRASGYRLDEGWDWHRLPGTTAVHFPIGKQKALEHRSFSPETFLGAASADGRNGVFGMILNQESFADGTRINLRGRKSVFFVDDLIVLLGSGISGGDGRHAVETTLFQSWADESFGGDDGAELTSFADPAGNLYFVPDTKGLKRWTGSRKSYGHDGVTATEGRCSMAWVDHGLRPVNAGYEAAVLVRGGAGKAASGSGFPYRVIQRNRELHHVEFPAAGLSAYAFFEPAAHCDALVAAVNEACLLMLRRDGGRLKIGLSNPDLGMLESGAPTPEFRWVSRDENQYRPSRPRPVKLTLAGRWRVAGEHGSVSVVSRDPAGTTLRFDCRSGMAIEVELVAD